jgi:succinate-acetate transporter protein
MKEKLLMELLIVLAISFLLFNAGQYNENKELQITCGTLGYVGVSHA